MRLTMTKVISFLNGKGGVGKTTGSVNVATAIVKAGHKVVVVDTDPQTSIGNWLNEDKCLFDLTEATSEKEVYSVKKIFKSYDYIIIDGAAAISSISAAAVMVSDVVLIPVAPSPLDFSACGAIISVIEARQELQPIIARFLIMKKIANTKMLSVLKESILDTGVPALLTGTSQRQSYIKSTLDGGTVFDTDDSQAKGEISVLAKEIMELFK